MVVVPPVEAVAPVDDVVVVDAPVEVAPDVVVPPELAFALTPVKEAPTTSTTLLPLRPFSATSCVAPETCEATACAAAS